MTNQMQMEVIDHITASVPFVLLCAYGSGLKPLQAAVRERQNVFESLMGVVKTHSLGQISHALYDVGGEYRRNM